MIVTSGVYCTHLFIHLECSLNCWEKNKSKICNSVGNVLIRMGCAMLLSFSQCAPFKLGTIQ